MLIELQFSPRGSQQSLRKHTAVITLVIETTAQKKKKGPEPKPGPSRKPTLIYCGGVFGVTEIGFGASGAFGAVNPGITGFVPSVPNAAA